MPRKMYSLDHPMFAEAVPAIEVAGTAAAAQSTRAGIRIFVFIALDLLAQILVSNGREFAASVPSHGNQ
jgi:hypothetical protein